MGRAESHALLGFLGLWTSVGMSSRGVGDGRGPVTAQVRVIPSHCQGAFRFPAMEHEERLRPRAAWESARDQ